MTLFRAMTGMAAFLPLDDTGLLQVLFIVFAAVAALLLIFVIVLFASKTVRKKLFRSDEKPSEEKPTENRSTAEDKPQKQTARVRLAYSDSVPTVPLSAPTAGASTMSCPGSVKLNMTLGTPQKQPTYKNSFDHIPTVEISHTDNRKVTDGNTYVAVPRTDAKTTGRPAAAQSTKKTAGTTAKPVLKFTTTTRPIAKTQTTTPKTVTKSPAPTAKPKTAATPAAKPAAKPAVKPTSAKTTERNGRK